MLAAVAAVCCTNLIFMYFSDQNSVTTVDFFYVVSFNFIGKIMTVYVIVLHQRIGSETWKITFTGWKDIQY